MWIGIGLSALTAVLSTVSSCSWCPEESSSGRGIVGSVRSLIAGGAVSFSEPWPQEAVTALTSSVVVLGLSPASVDTDRFPGVHSSFVAHGYGSLPILVMFKFQVDGTGQSKEISWVVSREPGLVTEDDWAAWNRLLDGVGSHMRARVAEGVRLRNSNAKSPGSP